MTRVARPFIPPHANAATHVRVMRVLSKATNEQLVQSLVDAKIVSAKGKLTAPYRSEKVSHNGNVKRRNARVPA
jgi:hypothetical protein